MNFDNVKRTWKHFGNMYSIELHDIIVNDMHMWSIHITVYDGHEWFVHNSYLPQYFGISYIRDEYMPPFSNCDIIGRCEPRNAIFTKSIVLVCDYYDVVTTNPDFFKNDINTFVEFFDNYGKDVVTKEVKPVQPVINGGASKTFSLEDMYDAINLHEGVLD